MKFAVDIPEELLPGLIAELSTLPAGTSPEQYFAASAVELLRQRCEAYKVGPYYQGPVPPKFNADGTLYSADPVGVADVTVIERAKNDQGRFVADDPSTPDVNEAWVDVETGVSQDTTSPAEGEE